MRRLRPPHAFRGSASILHARATRPLTNADDPRDLLGDVLLRGSTMAGTHLSIRIDLPSGNRIGPGKIALLEAIRSTGSISAAARSIGMSYRRA